LDADQTSVINFEYHLVFWLSPKYFKTISMIGEDNQEHHGILVERIHSSVFVKPGRLPIPKGRTTAKTLSDILIIFTDHGNSFKIFWRFNTHFSKFVNPLNFVF
jgi:hypothetical protein